MTTTIVPDGSTTFLQQANRNNWQQYLSSLQPGLPAGKLGWDGIVLTASDERQADMYRRQIELRREAGWLPVHTRFEVMPDPGGRRIGSGGATLRVLSRLSDPASSMNLRHSRVLVIHSGGESRRLPHCSSVGKLFARVPHELPDGRAATIFDEFLVNLSGLTANLQPGVLVASGDVALVFDHLQLSFRRPGVTGVSASAPVSLGHDHGVYVLGASGYEVAAYLHKPDMKALMAWNAVHEVHEVHEVHVQIDTGLVWLDAGTALRFAQLAQQDAIAPLCAYHQDGGDAVGALSLYADLLLPLAQSTAHDTYIADTSDGPCTPQLHTARRVIWDSLRGTPFTVEQLQPAVFIHFGSSAEYWGTCSDATLQRICNWAPSAAAWTRTRLEPADAASRLTVVNASVEGSLVAGADTALVMDSQLSGSLAWRAGALISGVRTAQPLSLRSNIVLSQLPVRDDATAVSGWVTRVYGLYDNPKLHWDDPAATFLNHPWADWLAAWEIDPFSLWPHVAAPERSLWNARLFPCVPDREESLSLALALQSYRVAPADWRERWQNAARLSLAESFQTTDAPALLADIIGIEDDVAVRRFLGAVEAGQPASAARRWLGKSPTFVLRRSNQVIQQLAARDPLLQIRAYKALSVACGDIDHEDRAFAIMADLIGKSVLAERNTSQHRASTVYRAGKSQVSNLKSPISSSPARVECPARIDFGGGWTDTPPYSIERGGCVLNAAITLRGAYPIVAEAAFLAEPRLMLESRDIGARYEPQFASDVLSYTDPTDPFALLKAALVVRDIIPPDTDPRTPISDVMSAHGYGLALSTQTTIPRGSGLGTSSILAGAVLEALRRLGGEEEGISGELFSEILWLEQLLTTGGGWQDQVGGLTGGIKLVSTEPGLPQRITVQPLVLPHHTQIELAERLVLLYTGQQRLAKNLLHAIVGRWMGRDTDMTWMLGEIARLALAMRDALTGGDLDGFGWLLAEHWSINKRMDPGCSNPFIDSLFEAMQPFICGGKLAGAGGGGFGFVLAKDGQAAHELRRDLAVRYRGTPVGVWDYDISRDYKYNLS
jgi:fucokinase